ncbi:MAG: hypothetical protein AB7O61_07105 [Acidimicrobiia bacterium]
MSVAGAGAGTAVASGSNRAVPLGPMESKGGTATVVDAGVVAGAATDVDGELDAGGCVAAVTCVVGGVSDR